MQKAASVIIKTNIDDVMDKVRKLLEHLSEANALIDELASEGLCYEKDNFVIVKNVSSAGNEDT